jgi:hypothetical protein
MFVYFTSKEQEESFDIKYKEAINKKQKELDIAHRHTKKIQKFTAKAHVCRPERRFIVKGEEVYLGEINELNKCPIEQVEGGETYKLDLNFEWDIRNFLNKYKEYTVTFYPDGKYGPTVDYISSYGFLPALLESNTGEKIMLEDENKYSLCVG